MFINSIHCGQLILRKISKIGANRCQILRLKCINFAFHWGSFSDPAGGAYSAPQTVYWRIAVFKGLLLRGGKGNVKGEKERGVGRRDLTTPKFWRGAHYGLGPRQALIWPM